MARMWLFLPVLLFFILGGLLWKGLGIDPKILPSALINQTFPNFKLESLKTDSKMLTRADLIGKPVLVNVWATWCPACRQEHAQLLQIANSKQIPIIGLNYKDERESALTWLEQLDNPYKFNIYDHDGMLGLDLGVYGAPETYLLDKNGIIQYRHVGVLTAETWQQLQELIHAL